VRLKSVRRPGRPTLAPYGERPKKPVIIVTRTCSCGALCVWSARKEPIMPRVAQSKSTPLTEALHGLGPYQPLVLCSAATAS